MADELKPAPQVGETWRVTHQRKGTFTARVLSDPKHEFFDMEIVRGRARFMSGDDAGKGDTITSRSSFVTFHERSDAA